MTSINGPAFMCVCVRYNLEMNASQQQQLYCLPLYILVSAWNGIMYDHYIVSNQNHCAREWCIHKIFHMHKKDLGRFYLIILARIKLEWAMCLNRNCRVLQLAYTICEHMKFTIAWMHFILLFTSLDSLGCFFFCVCYFSIKIHGEYIVWNMSSRQYSTTPLIVSVEPLFLVYRSQPASNLQLNAYTHNIWSSLWNVLFCANCEQQPHTVWHLAKTMKAHFDDTFSHFVHSVYT